jgi:CRISPR-associated protein Cmr4
MTESYKRFAVIGMGIDPIHVGTGGARLGRVDNTIVRDPVTRVPKIPGSSLAGVIRSYAAMAEGKFPNCAGQGQPDKNGKGGHCGKADCPVCTVFGFARGTGGGFAGLAAFSDAHVLLFPVATREGPVWLTCPMAAQALRPDMKGVEENTVYRNDGSNQPLNLGWLLLPRKPLNIIENFKNDLKKHDVPSHVLDNLAVVSDKIFSHVVNSNLEVRTSVSINPETGAAEEGALFSYEALPRATMLVWDVICKNPAHFKVGGEAVSAKINDQVIKAPGQVFEVVSLSHPYLEHLGIGGMGTRGMGRLRVLSKNTGSDGSSESKAKEES